VATYLKNDLDPQKVALLLRVLRPFGLRKYRDLARASYPPLWRLLNGDDLSFRHISWQLCLAVAKNSGAPLRWADEDICPYVVREEIQHPASNLVIQRFDT